ncbi:unnamed protein product [Dimorphilus gyrociliatus]|uniref:Uncharacterized protein n=1 Tax=Dimorphilus gyrociliatus TaxID=2664684 RepID=A0A7I8VBI0_9ANNE|nr:unnamed protein product [Dimorphilus gyrociliatus]
MSGAQKQLVDYYGDALQSTVFIPSHHTASRLANKRVLRDAIKPKALLTSNNPWYRYGHPRCLVLHAFRDYVQTLCKPGVTDPNDIFYCGEPVDSLSLEEKLQTSYTCGHSSSDLEEIENNEYAIYSSTPKQSEAKLIEFKTDGVKWNFKIKSA